MKSNVRGLGPAALLLGCSLVASSLGVACGNDSSLDESGDGGAGPDTGGRASGGGVATGGLGGLGGLGGQSSLPPGAVSCDAPAACGLQECLTQDAGANHYPACTELVPHTNPPTSGPHYTEWAQFGIYDQPIPKGYLQHGLEHSAVALLYNCDLVEENGDSCDELVAELLAFYDDYPNDPLCTAVPHRLYVIPDPDLDVPFAATAWAAHLRGQCFDVERVRAFVDEHYGMNYENICYAGVDPLDPGCD